MKEQILKLRKEGLTFDEIKNKLGCSKSTISYHCSKEQKKKSLERQRKNRKKIENRVKEKLDAFLRNKTRNFKRASTGAGNNGITRSSFQYTTLYKKLLENPVCYLTGRKIDLSDPSSYELDHIIPVSQGGKNDLTNCGLTCKEVNRAKHNLSVKDFIKLCEEVVKNNQRY